MSDMDEVQIPLGRRYRTRGVVKKTLKRDNGDSGRGQGRKKATAVQKATQILLQRHRVLVWDAQKGRGRFKDAP